MPVILLIFLLNMFPLGLADGIRIFVFSFRNFWSRGGVGATCPRALAVRVFLPSPWNSWGVREIWGFGVGRGPDFPRTCGRGSDFPRICGRGSSDEIDHRLLETLQCKTTSVIHFDRAPLSHRRYCNCSVLLGTARSAIQFASHVQKCRL